MKITPLKLCATKPFVNKTGSTAHLFCNNYAIKPGMYKLFLLN